MKKTLSIIIAALMCICAGAQNLTQKYNSLLERTEFFDSYGNVTGYRKWNDLLDRYDVYDRYNSLVGYYKYNDLLKRWEYFRN